uniref:Uncharacterized protein n=1 Tax=Ditylenchus dipsaci TaxID=166011 RepID=A0A915E5N6_9BILA
MSTLNILLLTVVFVVAANAQEICDNDHECYPGMCRGGVCFYPPSFRQLLVAANPIIRCRNSARCPEEQPYCVRGRCKEYKSPAYRLASYEVISGDRVTLPANRLIFAMCLPMNVSSKHDC